MYSLYPFSVFSFETLKWNLHIKIIFWFKSLVSLNLEENIFPQLFTDISPSLSPSSLSAFLSPFPSSPSLPLSLSPTLPPSLPFLPSPSPSPSLSVPLRRSDDLSHLPPWELPWLFTDHRGWEFHGARGQTHRVRPASHYQGRFVWKLHCPASVHIRLFHFLRGLQHHVFRYVVLFWGFSSQVIIVTFVWAYVCVYVHVPDYR